MADVMKSKTLSVSIECPPAQVYQFVSNPENLPQWGAGLGRSVARSEGEWIVDTPDGPVSIRFVEPNELGVLDHTVSPAPGVEILVPMRVVPNGSGSEVMFTVFQMPDMSDEQFAGDVRLVEQDLENLKNFLNR